MDEKPRYAIRRGAVELTRRQWVLLASVYCVGIVLGLALIWTISPAAGAIAFGLTAVAASLVLAFGRQSRPKSR